MSKKHQRKNYFIKKNFQGKLILGYFLLATGGCLLFSLILAAFSADTLTLSYQHHDLQIGQTPMMLAKNTLVAQWLFIVPGGGLVILAALFITHRMAGPLFRLERTLDSMNKKNLGDIIRLRKKDAGKELAAKINQFNYELSQQIRTINDRAKNIEDLLKDCRDKSTSTDEVRIPLQVMEKIRTQTKSIQEITGSFVLADE